MSVKAEEGRSKGPYIYDTSTTRGKRASAHCVTEDGPAWAWLLAARHSQVVPWIQHRLRLTQREDEVVEEHQAGAHTGFAEAVARQGVG